ESLSGGTKQLLALTGRLAVATLVDESSGAPVIPAHASGLADQMRLAARNVLLGNVGRNAQDILHTCRPGPFVALGGAETVRLDALNVILGNVGRNAQVSLLTCQPGRFGAIGGAETVSLA